MYVTFDFWARFLRCDSIMMVTCRYGFVIQFCDFGSLSPSHGVHPENGFLHCEEKLKIYQKLILTLLYFTGKEIIQNEFKAKMNYSNIVDINDVGQQKKRKCCVSS